MALRFVGRLLLQLEISITSQTGPSSISYAYNVICISFAMTFHITSIWHFRNVICKVIIQPTAIYISIPLTAVVACVCFGKLTLSVNTNITYTAIKMFSWDNYVTKIT